MNKQDTSSLKDKADGLLVIQKKLNENDLTSTSLDAQEHVMNSELVSTEALVNGFEGVVLIVSQRTTVLDPIFSLGNEAGQSSTLGISPLPAIRNSTEPPMLIYNSLDKAILEDHSLVLQNLINIPVKQENTGNVSASGMKDDQCKDSGPRRR